MLVGYDKTYFIIEKSVIEIVDLFRIPEIKLNWPPLAALPKLDELCGRNTATP